MLCGDLDGKKIQERGDICIHMANSLCCMVENNNIVKQLHSNKKFFLKCETDKYLEVSTVAIVR